MTPMIAVVAMTPMIAVVAMTPMIAVVAMIPLVAVVAMIPMIPVVAMIAIGGVLILEVLGALGVSRRNVTVLIDRIDLVLDHSTLLSPIVTALQESCAHHSRSLRF